MDERTLPRLADRVVHFDSTSGTLVVSGSVRKDRIAIPSILLGDGRGPFVSAADLLGDGGAGVLALSSPIVPSGRLYAIVREYLLDQAASPLSGAGKLVVPMRDRGLALFDLSQGSAALWAGIGSLTCLSGFGTTNDELFAIGSAPSDPGTSKVRYAMQRISWSSRTTSELFDVSLVGPPESL